MRASGLKQAACDPTLNLRWVTLGRIINWNRVRYCKRCEALDPISPFKELT